MVLVAALASVGIANLCRTLVLPAKEVLGTVIGLSMAASLLAVAGVRCPRCGNCSIWRRGIERRRPLLALGATSGSTVPTRLPGRGEAGEHLGVIGVYAVGQHAGEHIPDLGLALVARLDVVPTNKPDEVTCGTGCRSACSQARDLPNRLGCPHGPSLRGSACCERAASGV